MIGTGHPIHSFRVAERRTPAERFVRAEYAGGDSRWLMRDARECPDKPRHFNGGRRLLSIRAAVARLAAMLF